MDTAVGWVPVELLVRCLSFIDDECDAREVRCVSKVWRRALLESRESLSFRCRSVAEETSSVEHIHELGTLFPLARHLKIVAWPSRPFDAVYFTLSRPLKFSPQLSRVTLHKVTVDAMALECLFHTEQLREFKCTQVEFVDVGRWKRGSLGGVRRLYLSDCQFVSARRVARLTEKKKALGAFLGGFSPCELTLDTMELSDDLLGSYLSQLDKLTSLNLAGSRGFSHRAIARLPKFKLKELVLSACWVLNDEMCRVICEVCPGLECLGVYEGQISTTTVHLISCLCHLTTLDMGYSDGDVSPIDLQQMLHKLKGLTVLNLGGVGAVNDFVMQQIGQMKTLKRLDISGCPGLTSNGFQALSSLESLEDLACGWTSKLGDKEVMALPESLERLDVSYASALTDAGLEHLMRLVRLKELKLTSCKVSGEGIERIKTRGVMVMA